MRVWKVFQRAWIVPSRSTSLDSLGFMCPRCAGSTSCDSITEKTRHRHADTPITLKTVLKPPGA